MEKLINFIECSKGCAELHPLFHELAVTELIKLNDANIDKLDYEIVDILKNKVTEMVADITVLSERLHLYHVMLEYIDIADSYYSKVGEKL